jgi:hypothetical protein
MKREESWTQTQLGRLSLQAVIIGIDDTDPFAAKLGDP